MKRPKNILSSLIGIFILAMKGVSIRIYSPESCMPLESYGRTYQSPNGKDASVVPIWTFYFQETSCAFLHL